MILCTPNAVACVISPPASPLSWQYSYPLQILFSAKAFTLVSVLRDLDRAASTTRGHTGIVCIVGRHKQWSSADLILGQEESHKTRPLLRPKPRISYRVTASYRRRSKSSQRQDTKKFLPHWVTVKCANISPGSVDTCTSSMYTTPLRLLASGDTVSYLAALLQTSPTYFKCCFLIYFKMTFVSFGKN